MNCRLLLGELGFGFIALIGFTTPCDGQPCTSGALGVCEAILELRGGGRMPYYRNLALDQPQPAVRRAVVVIHGKGRTASGYFSTVVESARAAGRLNETVIVAPHFKKPNDATAAGQLVWNDRWKDGAQSTDQGYLVPRRSSFEIVDRFLLTLANRSSFPNLREIVVAGHSAGGQFSQRYAATNQSESQVAPLHVRYVAANAGSYMYLGPERLIDGRFQTPDASATFTCRSNHYKYGLEGRSGYVAMPSTAQIRTQYPARNVTYLLGEYDTGPGDLDQTCPATYQGPNRRERGTIFFGFMTRFFPAHHHKLRTVARVGHTGAGMFSSPEGKDVLFPFLPSELPAVPVLPHGGMLFDLSLDHSLARPAGDLSGTSTGTTAFDWAASR